MGQQFYFFIDPTGIACQTSVSPDDTMARNDDGNGIVPHCAANEIVEIGVLNSCVILFIKSFFISVNFFWRNTI